MLYRVPLAAVALVALQLSTAGAQILDYAKYPNLKGQWNRFIVLAGSRASRRSTRRSRGAWRNRRR